MGRPIMHKNNKMAVKNNLLPYCHEKEFLVKNTQKINCRQNPDGVVFKPGVAYSCNLFF